MRVMDDERTAAPTDACDVAVGRSVQIGEQPVVVVVERERRQRVLQ